MSASTSTPRTINVLARIISECLLSQLEFVYKYLCRLL